MNVVTIPRALAKEDDLVILPRKQYERFLQLEKNSSKPETLLDKLSREARDLKRRGKLPTLKSLRDLRA